MTEIPTRLTGFETWGGEEPFENHAGPFFMRPNHQTGKHLSAFICESRHLNGGGYLHGGILMSFADYALFVIARDAMGGQHAVTVSCQMDFLRGAAPLGEIVYADGEVTRDTRTLMFVRGRVYIMEDKSEAVLATFSGVLKKLGAN
ncbi:MAG: PaaI family thioesterase [Alphaproteobacteria bacterium]|nr:PaaI family thioesterase [Alphaproteobacteria bacterium]